jgi:hypothetical protein
MRSSKIRTPPPPVAHEAKTPCTAWILGAIGLLAIAGVITAIILSNKSSNGTTSTS